MKTTVLLGAVAAASVVAGGAFAGTLDDIKERGKLNCGISTGLVGFATQDSAGEWEGFDVAVCRAAVSYTHLRAHET